MSDLRRSIAHAREMNDIVPGERVESFTRFDGPALATGTVMRRCRIARDGWMVRWDNGCESRAAVANIRRISA